jgi:hypothetical protein
MWELKEIAMYILAACMGAFGGGGGLVVYFTHWISMRKTFTFWSLSGKQLGSKFSISLMLQLGATLTQKLPILLPKTKHITIVLYQ